MYFRDDPSIYIQNNPDHHGPNLLLYKPFENIPDYN